MLRRATFDQGRVGATTKKVGEPDRESPPPAKGCDSFERSVAVRHPLSSNKNPRVGRRQLSFGTYVAIRCGGLRPGVWGSSLKLGRSRDSPDNLHSMARSGSHASNVRRPRYRRVEPIVQQGVVAFRLVGNRLFQG
jgi:hypothetical protein